MCRALVKRPSDRSRARFVAEELRSEERVVGVRRHMNGRSWAMINIEDAIAAIYRSIDHRDWDDLGKRLGPDILYCRPGYPDLTGPADFIDFYKNTRQIDAGTHSLSAIIAKESVGCCWGTFSGVSSDGGEINVRFSDWYEFENGLVRTRRSFFFPLS